MTPHPRPAFFLCQKTTTMGTSLNRRVRAQARRRLVKDLFSRSGHYFNSIPFTFQNQGSVVKSVFSTYAQSRFASVVVDGVLVSLKFRKQRTRQVEGAVSAQKALQGS